MQEPLLESLTAMRSRTLPVTLVLSLAAFPVACSDDENSGVSASTSLSGTGSTDSDSMTSAETGTASQTGDGDGDMSGDGDGDPATGDGDGDPATGDGDGDPTTTGDGDGDMTGDGDGDMTGDGDGDLPPECVDLDQDGYGDNCDMGPDCNDDDWYNWTDEGCANCADADEDNWWVGCDQYDENQQGVDCDDGNYNVYSEDGCANCVDEDMDMVWVGCDQYDGDGPDCDDDNPNVGLDDAEEICNGLSENCAGEIDNADPNDMCPPNGVDAPNVDNWACNPPGPGQDGCEIVGCVDQTWDLDGDIDGGCECVGTDREESLANCSLDPEGDLGSLTEGDELLDIPTGTIPEIDNGIGGGAEDWYHFDIPENGGGGDRPNSGSVQVSFAVNDGLDYRFEVYRSCGGAAFANSLATSFGQGAPPVQEWWFFDDHVFEPGYTDNVAWPSTVYIRVFRVQNDGTCNDYQLQAQRVSN